MIGRALTWQSPKTQLLALACCTHVMQVITRDLQILGGTPVFRGTRVPVQTLFDHLEGGETEKLSKTSCRDSQPRRVNRPSTRSKKQNTFCSHLVLLLLDKSTYVL